MVWQVSALSGIHVSLRRPVLIQREICMHTNPYMQIIMFSVQLKKKKKVSWEWISCAFWDTKGAAQTLLLLGHMGPLSEFYWPGSTVFCSWQRAVISSEYWAISVHLVCQLVELTGYSLPLPNKWNAKLLSVPWLHTYLCDGLHRKTEVSQNQVVMPR